MKTIKTFDNAIVLLLSKREAAALGNALNPRVGYFTTGKTSQNIAEKLRAELECVGEEPRLYGLAFLEEEEKLAKIK